MFTWSKKVIRGINLMSPMFRLMRKLPLLKTMRRKPQNTIEQAQILGERNLELRLPQSQSSEFPQIGRVDDSGQNFCVECGSRVDQSWKFCRFCGQAIEGEESLDDKDKAFSGEADIEARVITRLPFV